MIVDDNIYNLIPLEILLKTNFGLAVDKAQNGQEAVDMYKADLNKTCAWSHRYSLILKDLNMPVMDGYDATKEILDISRE